MKVLIHTHDPMLTLVRLPDEAIDLFGEETLEEDGIEVPDDLVTEAHETYKKMCELSNKLHDIQYEHYRKKYKF